MSKNEVKLTVGAVETLAHGVAASGRKIDLAAELARGLNQTKARAWQHPADCNIKQMRRGAR